ncbi:Alginate_lyase2 domain-containing protein [Psidium guajava]|nr:Alginate_lyase2 domain-containing protein [Psidium guajava]
MNVTFELENPEGFVVGFNLEVLGLKKEHRIEERSEMTRTYNGTGGETGAEDFLGEVVSDDLLVRRVESEARRIPYRFTSVPVDYGVLMSYGQSKVIMVDHIYDKQFQANVIHGADAW